MGFLGIDEAGYEHISRPFRNAGAAKCLRAVNSILTAIGYIAYPLLIVLLAFIGNRFIVTALIVPIVLFVFVSVLRHILNRPRPYEELDIDPLIPKDTRGHSMPSRHAFSMMMIALMWFGLNMPVAIVLVIVAVLLAFIRVIGGVHYPRDVSVAILIALVGGLVALLLPF